MRPALLAIVVLGGMSPLRALAQDLAQFTAMEEEKQNDIIRNDNNAMSIIYGATFCIYKIERQKILSEIATQNQYGRIGGVQDNLSRFNLQNALRSIDEKTAEDRSQMKNRGKRFVPRGCSDKMVKKLLLCEYSDDTDATAYCVEDHIGRMRTFLPNIGDLQNY